MTNNLGTISLSKDILEKGNIGLWAFELDEGKAPRMYVDEPMLKLIGLDHQVSPEETYHAWYDHIDKGSYDLVSDAVEKMIAGEHAEVQYPWHHPNGKTMIVRCGGVRNPEYKQGVRIEGTHQDVTLVVHLDEEQKRIEKENLFNYFIDSYDSAYFVNLAKDTFEILHMEEDLANRFAKNGQGKDSMLAFIEEHIHPDDREMMFKTIDKTFVKTIMEQNNSYSFTVREIFDDEEKTLRCQIIRGADSDHIAVGFMDVTKEVLEQQKCLLGAIPLSSDILTKASIGLWAFELDEGKEPRMYADEAMLKLIGLEHQISPEETYHAWYDYIDEGSYGLVADAVEKMINGEHAEVQYPWHFPNGKTVVVRCGGVRNFEYKKGVRIEGTHQDVTQTLHFNEEERRRYNEQEKTLAKLELRVEALKFVVEKEPTIEAVMNFFGNKIFELIGCDQIVFRDLNDVRYTFNAKGVSEISSDICSKCSFSNINDDIYNRFDYVIMNDCKDGFDGVMVNPDCPIKSSFMQPINLGGKKVGRLTIHYINKYHSFNEEEIDIIKTVATYFGLFLGRIESKKIELDKIAAESSNKAKTEFLFNMSHDIRTPMNAILGFTDIAINHVEDKEKVLESLKKIKSSSAHLLSLINDILEMSRIEAGKLEIVNAPLDIYEAINKVDIMSQSLAVSRSIEYKTVVGNIKNQYILADELHVNQVLVNLISNAVKYTPAGGKVRFKVEQIEDVNKGKIKVRFTVTDTGIGMSKEFLEHIFESFTREKRNNVAKQEGAGLGLAIVKKIVDLVGGTISLKTKQNVGSSFIVEAPFEVMSEEEINKFILNESSNNSIDEDLIFKGKKVLLVEDNELNREIATEILIDAGFVVESAEDGDLAVKIIKEKGAKYYDLILMDIQMPIMNGYEATMKIRELPDGKDIPIIALSANAFEEDKKKSVESGMNDHIAKPIDINELFKVLTKYL